MNLILLSAADLIGANVARLGDRRATHVLEVLKARVGDDVVVGLRDGPIGVGRVVGIGDGTIDLELELGEAPPRPRVTIVLAMVRPQIMKRTLQHLATLGVRRVCLVGAARVEPAYFSQRLFDGDEYVEHLELGLEQARDTWVPEVSIHRHFHHFVADVLPGLLATIPGESRIVAHPESPEQPSRVDRGREVALAIGPEGGWTPAEVARLVQLGFRSVSLGPRIFRVETAVPYLFGALGL
jgi:16S rRNA (uracil1498-N3)-methyltransferase